MVRPKIKIELSATDKAVELIGWVALLTIWFITITSYSNLPDTIPTHYNGAGKVDGFGNKINILMLPLVATILFVGLTILNKFPHIFNYPTKITEENAFTQYTYATMLIRYLKLILVVIFATILFKTIQYTGGQAFSLWFLPMTMGLIFIPLVFYINKSLKKK